MTGSGASVTTRHFPRKGEKFIDGQWVLVGDATVATETTTTAPARIGYHEAIHPRKGMSAYERRNWMNARAGWPVKKGN